MFKSSFNLPLILVISFGILSLQVYSQKAIKNGKFFGKYEIPEKTSQPINIDSSKAKSENTHPIVLIGHTQEKFVLVNDGKYLQLILSQPNSKSRLLAFGGVYKFYKKQYYWTPSGTGVAGTTEDGEKGTPIEIFAYFYNEKYGSFKNARNYRDGMIDISFRIYITDGLPNLLFAPYDAVLQNVRNPKSSSNTTLGIALGWYSIFPPNTFYYAYPGSYFDEETEVEYFCSTTIILPHYPNMFISRKQFEETFGSLKSSQGKPLGNPAKQQPSDGIPVIRGQYIYQILIPNKS